MEYFLNYIEPELLILIPVLYLIGIAIKKSKIDNEKIPLILGACGIFVAGIYVFAAEPISKDTIFGACFAAITQGVLCAGASVYFNQIYKQAEKANEKNDEGKEE